MQAESEREYVEFVTARFAAAKRLAYLLSGDPHRADDLVQQIFTALYVRWRRVRTVDNLDAYLRRMLVRGFLSERRRAWWSRVDLTGSVPDRLGPAGPDLEDRVLLRTALGRVPRRQRAVLVLRFICDLPVAEVAQLLGCSEGTVKSQTTHGLAALRRALGERALAVLAPSAHSSGS